MANLKQTFQTYSPRKNNEGPRYKAMRPEIARICNATKSPRFPEENSELNNVLWGQFNGLKALFEGSDVRFSDKTDAELEPIVNDFLDESIELGELDERYATDGFRRGFLREVREVAEYERLENALATTDINAPHYGVSPDHLKQALAGIFTEKGASKVYLQAFGRTLDRGHINPMTELAKGSNFVDSGQLATFLTNIDTVQQVVASPVAATVFGSAGIAHYFGELCDRVVTAYNETALGGERVQNAAYDKIGEVSTALYVRPVAERLMAEINENIEIMATTAASEWVGRVERLQDGVNAVYDAMEAKFGNDGVTMLQDVLTEMAGQDNVNLVQNHLSNLDEKVAATFMQGNINLGAGVGA